MEKPDLIIFDCDGVLVDSEIIAARIEADLLTSAGFEITAEQLAQTYAGLTFKDILLRIEEISGLPFKATLIDEAEALVERKLKQDVRAIEGVREAILQVAHWPCYICSNSSTQLIRAMLEKTGILPLFQGEIFSARDLPDGRPKPAPDVFLHAVREFGADPARCFVVEDSVHGVTGARAAGMRVIGFTGGAHSYPGHADALTEAGAETVIRRWADFKGVLDALLSWSEDRP
ncbi:HAD family hydrolase [Aquamicrobium segne]|uniref:HAD family hydrolase n=1 Tax=Aquamicrobium segne TaxID=469547 RepID=A0ABW0GZU4_9HYPH